jgi:hypothetical protein
MSNVLNKDSVLTEVREASRAYARIAGRPTDTIEDDDVRFVVRCVLRWRAMQSGSSQEIAEDAAYLADFQASNFGEKLCSGMIEPIGILGLASKLGIREPTTREALLSFATPNIVRRS